MPRNLIIWLVMLALDIIGSLAACWVLRPDTSESLIVLPYMLYIIVGSLLLSAILAAFNTRLAVKVGINGLVGSAIFFVVFLQWCSA